TSGQNGDTPGRQSRTDATAHTFPVTVEHGKIVVDLRGTPVTRSSRKATRNPRYGESEITHISSGATLQSRGAR
ncbi:MAG: hypothetical protein EBV53_16815, partial [Proteobacteria bacterium]|nr:hypothetical protein [Pseudomonadota bacterium]